MMETRQRYKQDFMTFLEATEEQKQKEEWLKFRIVEIPSASDWQIVCRIVNPVWNERQQYFPHEEVNLKPFCDLWVD